mgnify:CR=1 FL=1
MIREIAVPVTLGLALFLFGMKVMEIALHKWAGAQMKKWMERFTETPFRGMMAGTFSTAILQSSTAITLVVIGLVNARVLTFPRTLGIILGTNIGSCVTTELVGLNITEWALPLLTLFIPVSMIGAGGTIVMPSLARARYGASIFRTLQYGGIAISGFACILLGMEVMQSIVPSLQSRGLFTWFLEQSKQSLLWGILAGGLLTGIIQSSAATIAIAMGLASVQAISLDLGIAIVLGANIGTCLTSIIASIGASKAGQFVAWSHVALNVFGVILFYPLVPLLREAAMWMGDAPSSQIAHAQTIFNIACSVLALPICYLSFWHKSKIFRP